MKTKKIWLALVSTLMITLVLAADAPAFAASDPGSYIFDISEGNITVAGGSGSDLHVTYGASQTQTADFANTQEITIIGTSDLNKVVVNIPGNTANITLEDAHIDFTTGDNGAFAINNGTVNLTLEGSNTLTSTSGNSGLQVGNTNTLTIEGTGSLTARGGPFGSGIGSGNYQSGGTIIINGGTITAIGGSASSFGGAGIGGGNGASGGTIIINDGNINATGGTKAAGIGGGYEGAGGTITIGDGTVMPTVSATGGSFNGSGGAGIGGGDQGAGGIITIKSGDITATGGSSGAGIGGGSGGSCGTVTIQAGTITATSSSWGAGIGGGNYGDGGTITISGGEITAIGVGGGGIGGGYHGAVDTISISSPATVKAVSDGTRPAIDAPGDTLAEGSTAYVLMANYSATKNSGTNTSVYLKSDSSLQASFTPDFNYKSIAFTISDADTYQLKTAGIFQQHDSSGTDFGLIAAGLTIFNDVADDADAAAVAADKAALTANVIKGENPDLANITVALTNPLPSVGSNGSTITWASDTPAVVSNDGQTVVIPDYASGDATVTLTATITKGSVTDTKAFTLTVLKNPPIFDIGNGDITVSAGTIASTLKVNYGAAQVLDNIPADQELFITGSSGTNKVVVNIAGKTANITLDNVEIVLTIADGCAFAINGGTVNLTLEGTNTLTSAGTGETSNNPGLRVGAGKTLNIDGTGSLTATGAYNAAGIGGGYNTTYAVSGTITINGGTVTAIGGYYGAGIGNGYYYGNGSTIINGGTITINGGSVTAKGGSYGAGIGGGYRGSGGTITVNGGTVTATGKDYGAGIGGGYKGSGGTINLNGGTVTAIGSNRAAGIGSGDFGDTGGTIRILSEATVTAVSDGTRFAIDAIGYTLADGSTAYVPITNFLTVKSSGATTDVYLQSDSSLETSYAPEISYKSIAFTLPAAGAYYLYSANRQQAHDGNTVFSVNNIGITVFNWTADYSFYTVTVKKDGAAWTSSPPELALSTVSDSLTGAITGTCTDGVYTFSGVDSGLTYYVWDTTNDQYTGKSLSSTNTSATVNYYHYTVTVTKDGETWTSDPNEFALSTASDSLTGEVTGSCEDGIYTFSGYDSGQSYYVWDTTNNQYTGQSLSSANTNATVDYYTVTLTAGTGIESTTGSGTYLSGSDVSIDATVSDGYQWYKWTNTEYRTLVSTTQNDTISDLSSAQSYTANAFALREEGVAWIDAGHYDSDLYGELTSTEFDATLVDISTPQQLAALARAVDIDGIDFSGVSFRLTQDINLSGYLWDPIGLSEDDRLYGMADGNDHPFCGNFDGNGYVITNMDIQGSYVSAGLFGNVNLSNLDDLGPDAVLVIINNVIVEGSIEVTDTQSVGGVVGVGGFFYLTNCVNQATITATNDGIIGGGVLGLGLYVIVDGCVNQTGADISITSTPSEAEDITAEAGGIAGTVFLGSIYNSANFASVTCSEPEGQPMVGGILGLGISGTVNNCYNTGNVTADGSDSLAGGICGFDPDIIETEDSYIRNCYNAGTVTATIAAGIAASVNATENCYYLTGTADIAYYDADLNPVEGTSLSATEMQADNFCQTLNDWIVDNPVSSSLTEMIMELDGVDFTGWVQRDGVNNGYPIFANDPRYVEPSDKPSGGSGAVYYTITVTTNEGGSVNPGTSDIIAHAGKTYTITPDSGYHISDVLVDDTSIGAVSSYKFINVSASHTLEVIFAKGSQTANPYSDVEDSDWFYDAVTFVSDNGLMNGMGQNRFEPGIGTSRAMIVSILWRLEEKPEAGSGKSGVFGDVGEGQWYTDGVEWAAANGVVLGYDAAHFGPNDCITREQLAAILYRYALGKGYDVSARGSLAGFTDVSEISDWALDAVQWAVAEGFLSGVTDTELAPRGSATRAQVAAILMRFMGKY